MKITNAEIRSVTINLAKELITFTFQAPLTSMNQTTAIDIAHFVDNGKLSFNVETNQLPMFPTQIRTKTETKV